MHQFIAYLIKNIVDKPDAVEVKATDIENDTILEVRVSAEDVAKVVGRQGRTIKSLRTIATSVGARLGRRVRVELIN